MNRQGSQDGDRHKNRLVRAYGPVEARRGETAQLQYLFPIGSARQFCQALSGPVTRLLG
jgi:hypothetical protein